MDSSQLQHLHQIGISLSAEHHLPTLLEGVLKGAKELTEAEGGTLYRVVDEKLVRFEIITNDTLGLHLGGTSSESIPYPDLPLFTESGEPNETLIVAYAVNHKQIVDVEDAYSESGFDFSGTRQFDEKTGYRTRAVLTVPILNHEGEVVAVLQLLKPTPFTKDSKQLALSLASQAGVAIENQQLLHDFKALFESFIRVIAETIDEKSPFTGNHAKRVPILTGLLARAVSASPRFETIFSQDQLEEIQIAAHLHDCGKIATPSYLMEKKSKLEGVFDRIDSIEERFEALCTPAPTAEVAAMLREELEFLKKCNRGEEVLEGERLQRISRWLKPGEIEHLTLKKGNLTGEERALVEHHVVVTHQMLSKLPFPKTLRAVAEIAASHHERIDGRGYPRGLKGEQILLQARILAIADTFEALSAPDRPYKRPYPLSQVFKIMKDMVDKGHIDSQLVDLFLSEKVYLPYASRFLMPEQIDVD